MPADLMSEGGKPPGPPELIPGGGPPGPAAPPACPTWTMRDMKSAGAASARGGGGIGVPPAKGGGA
jgi:hypothetical protein